ncbi:MAG TPA: hypothetical protein PJ982_04685, partial [Lacipirellulaceae bacterium]|nr:hypothetical protein [Lacipirellulaceae bacterium]
MSAKIGGVNDFANSYSYDALGRLTSVVQTEQGGHAVGSKRVDFAYNAASQTTSIARYAIPTTADLVASSAYTYDTAGRLEEILHVAVGGATVEQLNYGYDGSGRINWLSSLANGASTDYYYDARGQFVHGDAQTIWYDANGNRELWTGAPGSGWTYYAYQTNAPNRLVSDFRMSTGVVATHTCTLAKSAAIIAPLATGGRRPSQPSAPPPWAR